jgi:asparagine synthase (glutamine-hydrolysing)
MCGIAGVISLGERSAAAPPLSGYTRLMGRAISHRGPDEDGFLDEPGLSFVNTRLSIVGLADGRQPIANEDRSVWTVFNGEFFDYPERRAQLEAKGHTFRTHTDTELIPHLYEEHGDELFKHLRGQFAVAVYDARRRQVLLGRDRAGICPLFWTVQRLPDGSRVLAFASEVKALIASGLVVARPDPRGVNHVFTFFAVPGPVTMFEGVSLLPPGSWLKVPLAADRQPANFEPRPYWQPNFPDAGHEDTGSERDFVDRFEEVFMSAVSRRLRADVPVVSYLSGGVDSSIVVSLASKVLGRPIPTFTIGIGDDPRLNEESQAQVVARHVGSQPLVVHCGHDELLKTYPELIRAAEAPVIDTSCAALLMLARSVRDQGFKVALTGEGSDEWLAGYPWFKVHKLLRMIDIVPGLALHIKQLALRLTGQPRFPNAAIRQVEESLGGPNAWMEVYGLMSLSKLRFYSRDFWDKVKDHHPWADLGFDRGRMSRWSPLNRSLAVGGRIMLAGHLMSSKGDRVAMNSSVETRYPFLDEEVFDFLATVPPRLKMHGLWDKYILRKVAERWLPKSIAWRPKLMFRAPMDSFHLDRVRQSGARDLAWVDQLLCREALEKTGYFDAEAVARHRDQLPRMGRSPLNLRRTTVELGLMGVVATQLWHQTYVDGTLADLPTLARPTLKLADAG